MAVTYEPIASSTLASAAADITFSSIPGNFTDLVLVTIGSGSTSGTGVDGLFAQVNGDTATNYSETYLVGNGTSASSGRESSVARYYLGELPRAGTTTITPGITKSHFMSYSNTNVYKTMLSENAANIYVERFVNLWRSTSAITSIKIYAASGNLASGFTASLFGVKAA